MDHPRSKLPAVLAILFCIALLGGVGVLLWKTLPEKQQPQQAETIQTDSVFSSEQTAVEPEREAPYEGELPDQAEAAQPEQPDSEPAVRARRGSRRAGRRPRHRRAEDRTGHPRLHDGG